MDEGVEYEQGDERQVFFMHFYELRSNVPYLDRMIYNEVIIILS